VAFFENYRADELAEVSAKGNTYRLKVTGDGESASKWLTITGTELEQIIAVLEPEAYKAKMAPLTRITLPDLSK